MKEKIATIYSVLLSNGEIQELWMGNAVNLQEALRVANLYMESKYEGQGVDEFSTLTFTHLDIYRDPGKDSIKEKVESAERVEGKVFSKNYVLNEIKNTKNKQLYKDFKKIFTVNEKKLIEDILKK